MEDSPKHECIIETVDNGDWAYSTYLAKCICGWSDPKGAANIKGQSRMAWYHHMVSLEE